MSQTQLQARAIVTTGILNPAAMLPTVHVLIAEIERLRAENAALLSEVFDTPAKSD